MPRYAGAAREIVARRIIELAQLRETNRYRLRDAAVSYLLLSYKDDAKEQRGPNDRDAHYGNTRHRHALGALDGDDPSPQPPAPVGAFPLREAR